MLSLPCSVSDFIALVTFDKTLNNIHTALSIYSWSPAHDSWTCVVGWGVCVHPGLGDLFSLSFSSLIHTPRIICDCLVSGMPWCSFGAPSQRVFTCKSRGGEATLLLYHHHHTHTHTPLFTPSSSGLAGINSRIKFVSLQDSKDSLKKTST